MKRPLRALFFLSAIEIAVYLLVATVAWAVADHDLATLQSSFFQDVQTRLHAQIMAGVQGLILLVNVLMFIKILKHGEKHIAIFGLFVAAAVASLYFVPTFVSVYGLGGLLGLLVVWKALALLWKGLTWPFRRKRKTEAEAAKPIVKTAPSKKAG
jgi:hypothetical protein